MASCQKSGSMVGHHPNVFLTHALPRTATPAQSVVCPPSGALFLRGRHVGAMRDEECSQVSKRGSAQLGYIVIVPVDGMPKLLRRSAQLQCERLDDFRVGAYATDEKRSVLN
jgi:hypothetical protein